MRLFYTKKEYKRLEEENNRLKGENFVSNAQISLDELIIKKLKEKVQSIDVLFDLYLEAYQEKLLFIERQLDYPFLADGVLSKADMKALNEEKKELENKVEAVEIIRVAVSNV